MDKADSSSRLNWEGGHGFELRTPQATGRIESGGDRTGVSPMEGLLSSVAGCMAMDVVDILAKMRRTLTAYQVDCQGWRRVEHPRAYTRLRFVHRLTGPDLDQASADRAVHLSATRYCSASASLDPAIEIENVVEVLTGSTGHRPERP